ncbi:glycosyltransferase family 90 protein [Amylocarpus encephaloides]|uniref:Glycosyltransferase family 90 protein n=1 Tax=Amylocarpus encephaloides TaxID=45428 RepID=A0A9P8C672_9HELO|nr:glycosyltransferase family 90 protein [Amylocarpus encephaloides]
MQLKSPVKMTYPGPPLRRTGMMRYVIFAAVSIEVITPPIRPDPVSGHAKALESPTAIAPSSAGEDPNPPPPPTTDPAPSVPARAPHPIDKLIEKAEKAQGELLKKETHDLHSAAEAYRHRRGRHPPPGFDTWYDLAKKKNVVMVEDFFDQMYHDLNPFWGMQPKVMRKEAHDSDMVIRIRNQKAESGSNWFWTEIWLNMTKTIEDMLPDMDIPLNAMDEPRLVAPWEEINRLMEIEKKTRHMPPPTEVLSDFSTISKNPDPEVSSRPKDFQETRPYWKAAIRGCHPDSPARKAGSVVHFNGTTPPISMTHTLNYTYKGYVANYTESTDFCGQPDMQVLHGMMINPISVSESKIFTPLFGGSKLPTNNEILLPAPMYWSGGDRFTGGGKKGAPWHEKLDKVIWRGVATGGENTAANWKGFQRHRFVAQVNGTKISRAESWTEIPENWAMPTTEYNLGAQQEGRLGEWTKEWSDVGFVDLMCSPSPGEGNPHCNHTDPYFKITPGKSLAKQFNRKFLPDIDGNSFSGRYRGFLMSTSVPIKATIFKEWHDSRLMPWLHFVPMDNRFLDFWGIMEYFLGYKGKNVDIPGHDDQAEKIAMAGQAWANKVLRKEDMLMYVHRLLLEYARLSDDRREMMGWVDDLLPKEQPQEPPREEASIESSSP